MGKINSEFGPSPPSKNLPFILPLTLLNGTALKKCLHLNEQGNTGAYWDFKGEILVLILYMKTKFDFVDVSSGVNQMSICSRFSTGLGSPTIRAAAQTLGMPTCPYRPRLINPVLQDGGVMPHVPEKHLLFRITCNSILFKNHLHRLGIEIASLLPLLLSFCPYQSLTRRYTLYIPDFHLYC